MTGEWVEAPSRFVLVPPNSGERPEILDTETGERWPATPEFVHSFGPAPAASDMRWVLARDVEADQ